MNLDNQINTINREINKNISEKQQQKKNSIIKPLITAGIIGVYSLFNMTNAQQQPKTQTEDTEKIYDVKNIPAENLKFKLSPLEFSNVQDAGNNLYEIIDWLKERENTQIYLIDNVDPKADDFLVQVDEFDEIRSELPIRYQSFTNALSGLRNIPNKANSWDRLEITDFEKINDEEYVRLYQNPGDKTSWLSTRWDQIFNYLKLMPGIKEDEAIMKEIIDFNVNRQYGVDLDTEKMVIIPRIDPKNGQLSIEDIIYTSNETPQGKISGYVVARRDAPNYEFKKGHILIQEDEYIELPLYVIPKDVVLVQDFLSKKSRGINYDEPIVENPVQPVSKVSGEVQSPKEPALKVTVGGMAGYEIDTWHETDNFTDFNMDNRGVLLLGYLNLDHESGFRARINGLYFSPNETGYVDNKTNKKVGLFTNHEVDLDAMIGYALGSDNIKGFLGPKYVFEKRHPTIDFDVVFVESDIYRNIIGLEAGLDMKSGPFKMYIFGNYGLGSEDKTDSGINDNDVEASKSDIEYFSAGVNMGIGPFDLMTELNMRNYFAKQGFTQNRKEDEISIEGRYGILDNFFLQAGYRHLDKKVDDRKFNADIDKIYFGVGVKF